MTSRSNANSKRWMFKTKDDWRRWLWNRISESVPQHKRPESVVLYLPGVDDLEGEIASRHGFSRNNLVGIEVDQKIAKALRRRRVLCVNDEALNVIACWPTNLMVGVVSLDFCGGLTEKTLDIFICLLCHPAFSKCVVAMNFLRGRDPFASWHPYFVSRMHRGDAAVMCQLMAACSLLYVVKDTAFDCDENNGLGLPRERQIPVPTINKEWWFSRLRALAKPVYFTYSSTAGTQKFDSVVFQWDQPSFEAAFAMPEWDTYRLKQFASCKGKQRKKLAELRDAILNHRRTAYQEYLRHGQGEADRTIRINTRRKIAATLAHRTMRTKEIKK